MVLGNGMIATALKSVDQPEVLYAASGLSNAKGADPAARAREEGLLREQIQLNKEKLFVYISSYSIDEQQPENNTPYLTHKLNMERLVKDNADNYLIIRTSNVVGNSRQPGNLMNFIFQNLKDHQPFDIWTRTSRNLIDVQDLALMAREAINMGHRNKTLYVIHPCNISILRIVQHFESLTGYEGDYKLVEKGAFYTADTGLSDTLFTRLGLNRDPDQYVRRLIEKYFLSKR